MKRSSWWAGAAAILAAQGCSTGTATDTGNAGPDVTGRWTMFVWEDPVTVDIKETTGGVIGGGGCCGLSPQDFPCCGALRGQVADRRASFGFSFDLSGVPYDYSTNVFVSADGQRMTGSFSLAGRRVAWRRLGATDDYLPAAEGGVAQALYALQAARYQLAVSTESAPLPGADFNDQLLYQLDGFSGVGYITGDLGAFWAGEMAWNADEQLLTVGPVPATDPSLPVMLALRFDASATGLTSVDATMASGLLYRFKVAGATPTAP